MKKLIITALILLVAQVAYSQSYYNRSYDRPGRQQAMTFQVTPTILSYDGVKYGFGIGANYKQIISVNYFHTRDYGVNEEKPYLDNRYAGVNISIAQPIAKSLEVAVGMRKAALNNVWQKTMITTEARVKFSDSWRLGFEYGHKGERSLFAAKLIFNLY